MKIRSLALALATILPCGVYAQCDPHWLPGQGTAGVGAFVFASTMWDPDGGGPLDPLMVVGGEFAMAGGWLPVNKIAAWDGSEWSTFGSGIEAGSSSTVINSLVTLNDGSLVAAGDFTIAGGVSARRVARWDGTAWSAFGSGLTGIVQAIAVRPNGDLIAVGNFSGQVMRWDGVSWNLLGGGVTLNGPTYAVLALSNGDVIIGGDFTMVNGQPATRVARWNETTGWSAMGSGLNRKVRALAALSNGDIVAGGEFLTGPRFAARWDGAAWQSMGSNLNGFVLTLKVMPNGDLIAGGEFSITNSSHIARWDGFSWVALGAGIPALVKTLTLDGAGGLYAGGGFVSAGGVTCNSIARWNGAAYTALGAGTNGPINDFLVLSNGDPVAVGNFASIAGVEASHVGRRSAGAWSQIGAGIPGDNVYGLGLRANGDILAAVFDYNETVGVPGGGAWAWNGAVWSEFGHMNHGVRAVAGLPNGEVVAGGEFTTAGGVSASRIARFSGSAWLPMETGMVLTSSPAQTVVQSLGLLANGDLLAGGRFDFAGSAQVNHVARWNGAIWSALGVGMAPESTSVVNKVLVLPNGEVIAGGLFVTAGGLTVNNVARWNGSVWSALGAGTNGEVQDVRLASNGDVIASGSFTTAGGNPANRIARWDGFTWSAFDGGLTAGTAYAIAELPDGNVLAGGTFTDADRHISINFAEWQACPTCPADFDGDGFVTGADFDLYVVAFEAGKESADFDGDGFVSGVDFDLYVVAFEEGC